jgi:hypothetical protein
MRKRDEAAVRVQFPDCSCAVRGVADGVVDPSAVAAEFFADEDARCELGDQVVHGFG